nr:hypothetical protein [Enterobacter bugandensis]
MERFNRTYRTEILDFYLFRTMNEVREIPTSTDDTFQNILLLMRVC